MFLIYAITSSKEAEDSDEHTVKSLPAFAVFSMCRVMHGILFGVF